MFSHECRIIESNLKRRLRRRRRRCRRRRRRRCRQRRCGRKTEPDQTDQDRNFSGTVSCSLEKFKNGATFANR